MNLVVSAMAVLEGSTTFCPEPFDIVAWPQGVPAPTSSFMSKAGLLDACALANRPRRGYALHKLALSYQSCSLHMMDLNPGESPRLFRVQADPIYHVYLANAVTLAYLAIEELGLEIRASQNNLPKMPDGTWNPSVKADIERRLQKSGIDLSSPAIWTVDPDATAHAAYAIQLAQYVYVLGAESAAVVYMTAGRIQWVDIAR